MIKTVIAVFTVDTGDDGTSWDNHDIAASLEVRQGFENVTVFDSVEEFIASQ